MNRTLQERLKRIEALYLRPGSEGEKQAAARAILKIRQKLAAASAYQRPVIRTYEFEQFDKKI
jgi:hypothetical protein